MLRLHKNGCGSGGRLFQKTQKNVPNFSRKYPFQNTRMHLRHSLHRFSLQKTSFSLMMHTAGLSNFSNELQNIHQTNNNVDKLIDTKVEWGQKPRTPAINGRSRLLQRSHRFRDRKAHLSGYFDVFLLLCCFRF